MPRSPSERTGRPGRKKGEYSQAERVIALYDALQGGAIVRVDAFAEEVGASTRQIQRDLSALKARLGNRLERLPEGGWRIPREKKRGHDRRVALAQVLALELGAKLSAFLWDPGRMRAINARMDGLRPADSRPEANGCNLRPDPSLAGSFGGGRRADPSFADFASPAYDDAPFVALGTQSGQHFPTDADVTLCKLPQFCG